MKNEELLEIHRQYIFDTYKDSALELEHEMQSLNNSIDNESITLLQLSDVRSIKWNSSKICRTIGNLYIQKFNRILARHSDAIFVTIVVKDRSLFYMDGKIKTKQEVIDRFRDYADILEGEQ